MVVKVTNKEKIQEVASKLGLKIGCWHSEVELLSKKELDKVLKNIEGQADTDVSINRKKHVVEISIVYVDSVEFVDFNVLTKDEYISRYGDERWDNE
jgi:hypothetical protein